MLPQIPWKTQLWHRWKALRSVPFRRRWFVGYDLEGNSYWELKDYNNPFRYRRKVETVRPQHIGQYRACPQWMQWLRHTRPHAPTLDELLRDQQRIARMRILAQRAEERWQSVPLKGAAQDPKQDPRLASAWVPGAKVEQELEYSFEGNFTNDPISSRMYSAQSTIKQNEYMREQRDKKKDSQQPQQPPQSAHEPSNWSITPQERGEPSQPKKH